MDRAGADLLETTEIVTNAYEGDGVDHSSPLNVIVRDAATALASRLCRANEPGVVRIAVNTTKHGIFLNPPLLDGVGEEASVGRRVANEINALAFGRCKL